MKEKMKKNTQRPRPIPKKKMIPITWQEEDNELFFLCNKTI